VRRTTRWGFHIAAAGVGALALTLALEFGDPKWFEHLSRWAHTVPRQTASRVPARHDPPPAPVLVTPPRPLGNDSSVSAVPLPLHLVRTEVGRNNREGFAQIGVNARSPQTYAAGALLANGARLTEIYEHYVVLERDGRSARLYLQGEPTNDRGIASSAVTGLLTVGGTPAAAPAQINSQERLTDYLRPAPVFAGGQLHGYALFAGRNAEAFSQLGLQPGDVITQVNGSAVSGSSDSLTTLETLTAGEALSVVIERDGVAQSLSLNGAALKESTATPLIAPEDFASRPVTQVSLLPAGRNVP
jgi:type II secretion system protein C